MDKGLFAKHIQLVLARSANKQAVIDCVREKTGVTLTEEEVALSGKILTITTSSVKRLTLLARGAQNSLQEAGYTIKN